METSNKDKLMGIDTKNYPDFYTPTGIVVDRFPASEYQCLYSDADDGRIHHFSKPQPYLIQALEYIPYPWLAADTPAFIVQTDPNTGQAERIYNWNWKENRWEKIQ